MELKDGQERHQSVFEHQPPQRDLKININKDNNLFEQL